jgi:hypothetical protein
VEDYVLTPRAAGTGAAVLITGAVLCATGCGALAGLEDHELARGGAGGGGAGGAGGGGGGAGGEGGLTGGAGGAVTFQVQTLAEGLELPHGFAVDTDALFVAAEQTDQRALWLVPRGGGTAQSLLPLQNPTHATPTAFTIDVAVDPGRVYWTNALDCSDVNFEPLDYVGAANKDGQMPVALWQACGRMPRDLEIDATHVFFTDVTDIVSVHKGTLVSRVIARDQSWAYAIQLDDASAYWLAWFNERTCVVTTLKDPIDDLQYKQLFCSPDFDEDRRPIALAVDDDYVYWLDTTTIRRLGKTSTPDAVTDVAVVGGKLAAIDVDETHVYFTSRSAGTIARVVKAGGAPEIVASAQDDPEAVVVMDDAVYWTNYLGGQVMRALKP